MSPPVIADLWSTLQKNYSRLKAGRLAELFQQDLDRAQRYRVECGDLLLDYSRHHLDQEAWSALFSLADGCDLPRAIGQFLAGDRVNASEDRAALHPIVRGPGPGNAAVADARGAVNDLFSRMEAWVEDLHRGRWLGATGEPIRDVLNIGIGGSDLGPRMVVEALSPYHHSAVRCHFLANVDASAMEQVLARLKPATTLICVTSKSFGTAETLTNASSVKQWLQGALSADATAKHFVAVTANAGAAQQFGIPSQHILPLWDWLGGRYSLWAAFPIAAVVGMERMRELLDGAAAMDRHFAETPAAANMPIILALLGVWYRNVVGLSSYAVVPYDQRLGQFPAYLQQLDMESNGKRVDRQGQPLRQASGPVCWGGVGTEGQHAFFQWLHQATEYVPVDLIGVAQAHHPHLHHHRQLLANLLGQAKALMLGRDRASTLQQLLAEGHSTPRAEQLAPHLEFPGNRPSSILLLRKLTPAALGNLLALYEHKVFVQSVIWGNNPFDQWGVELGKGLAREVEQWLASSQPPEQADVPTQALIQWLRQSD